MSAGPSRCPRPLVLVILDGFGLGRRREADAIAAADMPAWRALLERWPHSRLGASAQAVGLPAGQMGNSEVGHLNIGAGQPVVQDLPRIDRSIEDGSFFTNPRLLAAARRAAQPGRRLHLIGLIGPGGVHSVDRHAVALARLAWQEGARDVVVHALLDGRDTPPRSADRFLPEFEKRLAEAHREARVATVGGRYYGMDRDRRWDRTQAAYGAIVHGEGPLKPTALVAVLDAYESGETDEFVAPTVIGTADSTVRDGDVIVHFNFRADRARQLIHALVDGEDFAGFERGGRPRDLLVVTMTEYEAGLPVQVAFPPLIVTGLAEIFADLGWRQLHVAETEKYAHVTYFFNGGREEAFDGEERVLVPSPKVATYDLQPEMSAEGVTDAVLAGIRSDTYEFIVANFANPDMVGHTGSWPATIAACEFLDRCLARIASSVLERDAARGPTGGGAVLCVTADHGNADELRDEEGRAVTAHSLNPVPLLLAGSAVEDVGLADGVLADVAPTLLELLDLPAAQSMTGRSLLRR
ncbi:MAG: 2,3-bisphosphoglycerate-independent phosphoglycerate mutase [Chloroflexota bacterium]|nr:2,3-bisphosphoglycerate-independent phosphoglycerate mutase [Chloroflexota bacterium]